MSGLRCLHGRRASGRGAVLGLTGVFVASGVLACLTGSAAGAAALNLSPCDSSALSQPFLPWGDPSEYKLAPDGTFNASGWTLGNGAQIASGTDPIGSGSSAPVLQLVPGASAVSGSTCVDAAYPTVRMFVAGTGTVAVSVVYRGFILPAGIARAGGAWRPTVPMVTWSAIPAALSAGAANVSLLLTGISGQPVIDDVYIDPWNRG